MNIKQIFRKLFKRNRRELKIVEIDECSFIKDLMEDQFKRLYKYDDTRIEVKGKAYLKDEQRKT